MESGKFLKGITRTIFMLRSFVHQYDKKGGVSLLRLIVLKYIGARPKVTMKDIAEYLDVSTPSASSIIDNLVKLKAVKREEDEKDRRLTILKLTSKGKSLIKTELEKMEKQMQKNLAVLSLGEQKQLFTVIQKLYKNLSARNNSRANPVRNSLSAGQRRM